MTALMTVVGIVFFNSGCLLGVLTLALAAQLFVSSLGVTLTLAQQLCLTSLILAAPLASLILADLAERFCATSFNLPIVRQASCLLCLLIIFSGDTCLSYFEAAFSVVQNFSLSQGLAFFSAAISAIVFCAGISALALMLFSLSFELLARWISSAMEVTIDLPYAALRMLLLILAVCLSINLISGLFMAELSPLSILGRLL